MNNNNQDSRTGKRFCSARVNFEIIWSAQNDGESVKVDIKNQDTPENKSVIQSLGQTETSIELTNGDIHMFTSVWLKEDGDKVELWLSYPIDEDSVFNNTIACWFIDSDKVIIENIGLEPENSFSNIDIHSWESIFPFLCLDTSPVEIIKNESDSDRYLINKKITDVTIYKSLLKKIPSPLNTKETEKIIEQYILSDNFIHDFHHLDFPFSQLPDLLESLRKLSEHSSDIDIELFLSDRISQPIKLSWFFDNSKHQAILDRLWSSLISLILTNNKNNYNQCLLEQLVISLRVLAVLELIYIAIPVLKKDDKTAEINDVLYTVQPDWFQKLDATIVIPDILMSYTNFNETKSNKGWFQFAGIGDVRMVYLTAKSYELGDIANITNLISGEERYLSKKSLQQNSDTVISQDDEQFLFSKDLITQNSDEFTNEVKNVIAVDEQFLNASNLTPSYDNLGLVINGVSDTVWTENTSDASLAEAYARNITQKASENIKHKVSAIRKSESFNQILKTTRTKLNNSQGRENINAIYRWVDMIHHFSLKPKNRALIVEFMLDSPASEFLNSLFDYHNVPITQPDDNGLFSDASNYSNITEQNYLQYQAQFEAGELPPPPKTQFVLTEEKTNNGSTLIIGCLKIPQGYLANTTNQINFVVNDASQLIAGYVGDTNNISHVITAQNLQITQQKISDSDSAELSESPETAGNSEPSQPIPVPEKITLPTPQPAVYSDSFSVPDNGETHYSFSCHASEFSVELSITLTADTSSSSVYPQKLLAWQQDVFRILQNAYQRQVERFNAVYEARLEAVSRGRTRSVERDNLKSGALTILTDSIGDETPEALRFFNRLFLWEEMAYQFFPWQAGELPSAKSFHSQDTRPVCNDSLFHAFINSSSARVLVPINPRLLTEAIFTLLFKQTHYQRMINYITTNRGVALLEAIETPLESTLSDTSWSKRVPTTHVYLQADDLIFDVKN